MQELLNKGIKEVISEFPDVGVLLDRFGIGCVSCGVGTCAMKDIMSIHNLPKEQEVELMEKIHQIIMPGGKPFSYTPDKSREVSADAGIKYSPPMKRLVDEHTKIKQFLGYVPAICNWIEGSQKLDKQFIKDSVNFIKTYADKYHHAKEEDILFKYADENSDIIKVMFEDHKTGRAYVKSILDGLEENNITKVVDALKNYRDLLTEHIKKEDEILYPWIDRALSITQVGELSNAFDKADSLSEEVPRNSDDFIQAIEPRFNNIASQSA